MICIGMVQKLYRKRVRIGQCRLLTLMMNVKKYYAECTTNLVQSVDSKNKSCFHDDIIKIENFSSLKKLFPVSCLVLQALRFVKNSLANLQSDEENIIVDVICFDEISGAKYFWLSD